jgi:cytochrome c oxidase assembly protein subunit 15
MPAPAPRRAVAAWLYLCCVLVFAMVVVGGITRLTHSGLSIVEWQPLVGAVPPTSDAQWEELFAKYRESPEFRVKNFDMTLAGFKEIFWWEYAHRLLGRIIGVVFLLPFLYFLARRAMDWRLALKLLGVFALGALQAFVGWYMVKSGLVDDPRVSPIRLAAHLELAFVIYGALLYLALGVTPKVAADELFALPRLVALLVLVMVLSGALVAGIHAGLAYNTFPMMNGRWAPPDLFVMEPWWRNFAYNVGTVQFVHRALALIVALAAFDVWWRILRADVTSDATRRWGHRLLVAVVLQIGIGITTLLLHVPIMLAALHQAGALLVFTCAIGLVSSTRALDKE